jgi:hypothetical protein
VRIGGVEAGAVRTLVAVALVVGLAVAAAQLGRTAAAVAPPPLPDQLRLVLAVPDAGQATPSLILAVQHEAALATGWLEGEVGQALGSPLDWAHVAVVDLPDQPIAAPAELAARQVEDAARAVAPWGEDELPVILTPLALVQDGPSRTCGIGGPLGIVVFMGNCPTPPSTATTAFGRGVNRTIAHELVHAMGGVADCAPNGEAGHVVDDPADLMLASSIAGSGTAALDAAGDDYLGRGGSAVCADIRDSPLWAAG